MRQLVRDRGRGHRELSGGGRHPDQGAPDGAGSLPHPMEGQEDHRASAGRLRWHGQRGHARPELLHQGRTLRLGWLSGHGRSLRAASAGVGSQASRDAAPPDPASGSRARHVRAALGARLLERDWTARRRVRPRADRVSSVLRAVRGFEAQEVARPTSEDIMATSRRVNVASGRQLEQLAHYSRAVRVGDTVLQSGTTAIDRQGNVRGVGNVADQVDAIVRIASWSMGKAGGRLEDVVRSRIYVTDISVADQAARAIARHLRDARPASTLVQVNGLARPEQLIEIEFDAVDGAGRAARRISSGRPLEQQYAYSRAVRVGDRVFISGSTALNARGEVEAPGDMYRKTRANVD